MPSTPEQRRCLVLKLVAETGVSVKKSDLLKPCLSVETVAAVSNFYLWSPGRKESLSIKGEAVQKRYLLMSLKEAHVLFSQETPHSISLSAFCNLRFQHVAAFRNTPLNACCCTQHENFKKCVQSLLFIFKQVLMEEN